jgi:DNA-binding protein HU-beta
LVEASPLEIGSWALNKAELVDIVAKEAATTKKDAEQVINKMMETIIKHVATGEKVTLVGFGTFEARQRKARTGRNPKTNEPLHIPAKRVPGFRVGKEFSEAVNKRK